MLHVICFYWQGTRWNRRDRNLHNTELGPVDGGLASVYVNNLYRGVNRFADRSFKFVCFTNERLDLANGIETRPFPVVSTGVLPRMYMFSRDAGLFGHQVLCLDLDVVITGLLDKIMSYRGLFCARSREFNVNNWVDGDIMSFAGCEANEKRFWQPFNEDPTHVQHITGGRERYWIANQLQNRADRFEDFAPGQIISYKKHTKAGWLPRDARIVSFHGYPRPHQATASWIQNYWRYYE